MKRNRNKQTQPFLWGIVQYVLGHWLITLSTRVLKNLKREFKRLESLILACFVFCELRTHSVRFCKAQSRDPHCTQGLFINFQGLRACAELRNNGDQ